MTPVIRTYSGLEVNPLDLRPEDINLVDIAHALSLVNRFGGHTKRPLNVAQHSVYVSRLVEPYGQGLAGLLHDAAEAYVGDMTKWMKHDPSMAFYREAEARAAAVIGRVFGIMSFETPEIDWADRVMVRFEGTHRYGMGQTFLINNVRYPPLTEAELTAVGNWTPWSWKESETAFHVAYRCLENEIT